MLRLCLGLVLFLTSFCTAFSQFQPSSLPRADFPVTDGPVHAILETNGVIYIGGEFTSVSLREPKTALVDIVNGLQESGFPFINGVVNAAAPDGNGGWYIGGKFTSVGGEARTNLARILSNNTVDLLWNPSANDTVHALLVDGGLVYVGGQFTTIAGQTRRNLAALDKSRGVATTWNPDVCCDALPDSRSQVLALAVSDGRLFVGGAFSFILGQSRNHVAALDLVSGVPIPWPKEIAETGSFISSLRVTGDTLFVAGRFQFMGGNARNNLAAIDTASGTALPWNPGVNGDVLALELSGSTLFAGGDFNFAGGEPRSRLTAFNLQSGSVTDWNPDPDNTVRRIAISGSTIFIGGDFNLIGGAERNCLAALNTESRLALPWNPSATGRSIQALAINGTQVLASSQFNRSAKARSRLAALDAGSGRVLDWNPGADNTVLSLAFAGDTVFAGGEFLQIAGTPRSRIAAIYATSGELSPWGAGVAGPNARVVALGVGNNQVYAGGGFTAVGPLFSPGLVSFDLATGESTGWQPRPTRTVLAIDVFGDTVYAAGNFTSVGGQSRRAFAALEAVFPFPTSWNPDMRGSGTVGWAIVRSGNTVYAGGSITNIAGQPRRHLVALDATTASVTAWDPRLSSPGDLVQRLSVTSEALYVAGTFSSIGGQPRRSLAALDRVSANALEWDPDPQGPAGNSPVSTVVAGANAVYAGGAFTFLRGRPHQHFAAFAPLGQPVFTLEPSGGLVLKGQTYYFSTTADGTLPIAYQWQLDGTNIPGATSPNLLLANAQSNQSGTYTVIASNALGAISSSRALLTVTEPLVITRQLGNTAVESGTDLMLSVDASGNPPPQFQWKLNGAIIPGQSFSTLELPNAQPADGGIFSVTIYNGLETIESRRAAFIIAAPSSVNADAFVNRTILIGASGTISGHNGSASREPGEPNHANKDGGRSIWYSWIAPSSGIGRFTTQGSAFDTLLAVYTNSTVSGTNLLCANDDHGGLLTSLVSFAAVAGNEYQIALDGYAGGNGRVVLGWSLETTADQLPRIVTHPMRRTVGAGATVDLTVTALETTPLEYQWFRNGVILQDATNAFVTLTNLKRTQVGNYSVLVRTGGREIESLPAAIEIGPSPSVSSQDKFQDLFAANFTDSIQLVTGSVSTQIFDNTGATTQSLEPNHGNVPGGSSKWFRFRATTSAVLQFDTIGSVIDTTLAVYTGTNFTALNLVARDNNSAPDAARSLVRFNAMAGVDYHVAVDGYNGAQGLVQLNWQFGHAPVLALTSFNPFVRLGDSLSLNAGTGGTLPPPTYQWRLEGKLVADATNATLALTNFQATQAGTYSVVIRNFAGGITNYLATVNLIAPIVLSHELVLSNGQPAIRFTGPITNELVLEGTRDFSNWVPLQMRKSIEALDVVEPLLGVSPYRFYRGLITPATGMRPSWITNNGQRLFQLSGPISQSLIVESSMDLFSWEPMLTNSLVAPFEYIDFNPTNFPTRFYRLR